MEINGAMKKITRKGVEFEIDKQDESVVDNLVWRIDHGYLRNKSVYLHRMLLDFPKGCIDHIDGNPLNNKRNNLRICSQQENTMNKRKSRNSSSKFKGVSWIKRDRRWYACINKDYKTYSLGTFKDEIDAAKAYDKKAIEMFGKYAKTNLCNPIKN